MGLAPSDFHVIGIVKNMSEAGDFHLTTAPKQRFINGFGSRTHDQ
jgi:hypothetical protein